jgi:hypothetical protein
VVDPYDSIDLISLKATWTTSKNIFWLKIQDMFFKKTYWDKNILDQPRLTKQIYDPVHEIMITQYKANQPNVEW